MRTVKYYSNELTEDIINNFLEISATQQKLLNYCWNRFSGKKYINSSDRDIRDLLRNSNYQNKTLNKSYIYDTVEYSKGILTSNLNKTKKKIKSLISKNKNLTKEDKHYLNFIFTNNRVLQSVINYEKIDYTDKYFKRFDGKINFHNLNNKARRYYRKYKGKIPKSRDIPKINISQRNYSIKDTIFNLKLNEEGSKRTKIQLTSQINVNKKPNLYIFLNKKRLEIHFSIDRKIKNTTLSNQELGIDLGLIDLFVLSNGNLYGKDMNTIFYNLSDNIHNPNRNRLYSLYKKYSESNSLKDNQKAENILKYNLGKIKYNTKIKKAKENIKNNVNKALNDLISIERPKELIIENLNWNKNKGRMRRRQRNRFNTWTKEYIKERLIFKAEENQIPITIVNPAYTSQICNKCSSFGLRNGKHFSCPKCELTIDADENAAINIKNRKYIQGIDLYTSVKEVKNYFLNNPN